MACSRLNVTLPYTIWTTFKQPNLQVAYKLISPAQREDKYIQKDIE
jgi:hypothetical protein